MRAYKKKSNYSVLESDVENVPEYKRAKQGHSY